MHIIPIIIVKNEKGNTNEYFHDHYHNNKNNYNNNGINYYSNGNDFHTILTGVNENRLASWTTHGDARPTLSSKPV